MLLIPAIDIKDGHCVRLKQGDMDGKVATDGWSKLSGHEVIDLAKKFEDYGCEAIVYTDIGRDGMMGGINIEATVKLAQSMTIPVIASGGVHSVKDIEALCAVQDEG